jgi:alcohol dehydrogenase
MPTQFGSDICAACRLKGASLIIGVDSIERRLNLSRQMEADEVIDFTQEDPVAAIKRLTDGRGVDVAIEALGRQGTFQARLDATRPGGIVSSLGVYGGKPSRLTRSRVPTCCSETRKTASSRSC